MKEWIEASLFDQSKWLSNQTISCTELTQAYITHVEQTEPHIQAFITTDFEGALESAKKIDEKRQLGRPLSQIAGIPMGLKDNICTVDLPTTCASKMLENYISPYDAYVTTLLKKNDAIILGKLNMDEFAMGSDTSTSYFKRTKNPHDLSRVPGGSSGGSAAAVSSHEVTYSLGSDTGGSIRQPASFCGVVGLKPSYGRISRNGLVAFASSLDQIGPMAKSVREVAYIYRLLSVKDALDSTFTAAETLKLDALLQVDPKKLRIALPKQFLESGIQDSVKSTVLEAAKVYEQLGATVELVDLNYLDLALPAYYLLSSSEASSNLARFDGIEYGYQSENHASVEALYEMTRAEGFGSEVKRRILLGTYALSSGYYEAYYKKALKMRKLIQQEFDRLFQSYDVILSPVTPTTAYRLDASHTPVETYLGDIYTVPVNLAGLPALSLNAGFDDNGLPIGIQLIGNRFCEQHILSAAYLFEQTQKIWRVKA